MTHQESEERRLDKHEDRRESRLDRQQSDPRSTFNGIVLVVVSIILSVTVGLLSWTMLSVVQLGKDQAKTQQKVDMNTQSIDTINTRGSPIIQAVLARLDSLQAGQTRMEKSLDDTSKALVSHVQKL